MTLTNWVLIGLSALGALLFFQPKLLKARLWKATVTPLASIIGSGFLVAGPILGHTTGNLAWMAMLLLCGLGYLFGSAIRSNILHLEDQIADGAAPWSVGLERIAELALSLAYFISVAYYLNLFAAFGLRLFDITDTLWIRIVASIAIGVIGAIGAIGGLSALEKVETQAVGLKLAVILGLLGALAVSMGQHLFGGTLHWPSHGPSDGLGAAQIVLGLVVLVQGFETSRYLGAEYSREERVRTMRWAQWIATGIYVAFILMISPFERLLPSQGGETAIIDMLRPLGFALAPLIIVAALASQSSAAVADLNGAGGLLAEALRGRLSVRLGNLVTAVLALIITWTANLYEIIAYASKAFVVYYALQSLQATLSAWRRGQRVQAAIYAGAVLIAVAIVLFGKAAEA